MQAPTGLFDGVISDPVERLTHVVKTMRELSTQTDPYEMGRLYGQRMRTLFPVDASISVSRRDLSAPWFRITRSSRWQQAINPWKEKERLPLLSGGFLAELLYANEPRVFDDFRLAADDPAREYLGEFRSLLAIPLYDRGEALNMVLLLRREPNAFPSGQFPELVWMSNLYGRATHNLVLSKQLEEAWEAADYEMKVVAEIQRSLLPPKAPVIPGLGVAAWYQTSSRAGGDYYDFFPLYDGRWGMLIADVSGHGTPAAVIMAVAHTLAHTFTGPQDSPSRLLNYLNEQLSARYTVANDTFVTAFHAIYDPASRVLSYSSAGHNPPRLKRCWDGSLLSLDRASSLPLGLLGTETYGEENLELVPGDQLILYTDGITEAHNPRGEQFGLARLDKVLENCSVGASDLLRSVLAALDEFTAGRAAHDDRTLLVMKVS
jgi:sigma-B regulation protein RsbU (phosphoserine phosphatase)